MSGAVARTAVVVALCTTLSPAAAQTGPSDEDRRSPDFVARVGDKVWKRDQIAAELAYLPPAALVQARSSDSAAQKLGRNFLYNAVFAAAAEADGFVAKNPGLAAAAAAQGGRELIAKEYMRRVVVPAEKVGDAELEQYYKLHRSICRDPGRYRLARILIALAPRAGEKEKQGAKERLDAVRERLRAGEDFAKVADELSDAPAKGPGGDAGWFTDAELGDDPSAKAITALAAGAVGDPVTTSRGHEIVKMTARQDGKELSLAECRDRLAARIRQQYRSATIQKKAEELVRRFNAYMNIDNFTQVLRSLPMPDLPELEEGGAEPE